MELTAREIAAITGGAVHAGDPDASVTSYTIDTRDLQPGGCFVALVATRDGHDFVADAFARAGTVAVVTRDVDVSVPVGAAIVRVDTAFTALARLGSRARESLTGATVVGITGSSGKTSTKDLTEAALAQKFSVHASPGSYNNEAGVPLTLLAAPQTVEAVVLEMGARKPGNISELCAIARPGVGVITNIGLAHAEFLGDREGVARVKGELLEALDAGGLAVLDSGEDTTPVLARRTAARVVLVGVESARGTGTPPALDVLATGVTLDAELRPTFVLRTAWGSGPVTLNVRGAHHVHNASLAAAVALASGVAFEDVAAGLTSVAPAPWRMGVARARSGALVIDDAYNANPSSTAAALRALAHVATGGERVAVLGEMLELGDHADAEHARIGALAADLGIDVLVAVGAGTAALATAAREASRPVPRVIEVADAEAALTAARGIVGADDAVLVKGSRRIGLERVAEGLREGEVPA
jgi:UDP-N-acetylmuramoyl-tripeptide--D-alanyl-D-alanine ligase